MRSKMADEYGQLQHALSLPQTILGSWAEPNRVMLPIFAQDLAQQRTLQLTRLLRLLDTKTGMLA